MQTEIDKQNWCKERKERVKLFLKNAKFYVVDGEVLLSENTLKALGDLMDAEQVSLCESCERHEAGSECYQHVQENPPERY